MNIDVKHNGNSIVSHVLNYSREHRICTSIGTLNITLDGTYSTTIDPWDTIDIHENGDFKVRYYVSDVAHSVPDGTIILQCQDKSKRLVDYFIPDSYTIDYPSTTKYWIQKFLTEAGISYNFTTSSPGNLLSNYTALGLQPAYDQIMMLLQLSGWYMYFDGNGVAVIGSLDVDLAHSAGSLSKLDIIDIKKVSNDKMLRNRALIWGEYDPFRQEYAFADVTRHTRWDYDNRDVRTMVVSNQNIPNSSSAHSIANVLLKEFTKLTIEKHIAVHGARDFNLGNAVRVSSDIWRGKGLITTFGVNMDRNGLVTTIVLDERCPRLFGFFNFGDYVYVGTFGDGVWRKHIKFDPTWYNFSTGLLDLNITDLHINNGIFGAVAHSGAMYYANSEEGPWYEIPTITGLQSSKEDEVDITAGSGIEMTGFSGIMARAVIVDKITNIVKFGVDTWSGLNTGDYFLSYSGLMGLATLSGVVSSGVLASGDNRGWIVEYDPYTGEYYTTATSSGIYPISYSGNYDIRVLDLENDGVNDYVSVKTTGVVIQHSGTGYNLGKHTSQTAVATQDDSTKVSFNTMSTFDAANKSLYSTLTGGALPSVFDNESIGEREVVYYVFPNNPGSNRKLKRITIDVSSGISSSILTSPAESPSSNGAPTAIIKMSTDVYRILWVYSTGGSPENIQYLYSEWNTSSNTLSSQVSIGTFNITLDPYHTGTNRQISGAQVMIDEKLYVYNSQKVCNTLPTLVDPDYNEKVRNYIKIYAGIVDIRSGSFTNLGLVFSKEFRQGNSSPGAANWQLRMGTGDFLGLHCYQSGSVPSIFTMILERDLNTVVSTYYNNWLVYARDGLNFHGDLVQASDSLTNFFQNANGGQLWSEGQLTGERFYIYAIDTAHSCSAFYNGDTIQFSSDISFPWNKIYTNIFPLFGEYDNYYIAKNGTDWYFCNPQTLAPEILFAPPAGYTIKHPYCTTDTLSPRYYWLADKPDAFNRVILKTTESAIMEEAKPTSGIQSAGAVRSFVAGNFFLEMGSDIAMLYLNNNVNVPDRGTKYLVLQRENTDFNLIREASKPIRIDISNSTPVLTILDNENTFHTSFVFNSEVTTVIPVSGLNNLREVRDYRYTSLETTSSGTIVGSGVGMATQILYVTQSGVYYSDANTYSGGFLILDTVASGLAERIETTNNVYPGQFIFVTTSGDNPMFYQRDNDGLFFTSYSGLPDSRATIIRCDDRL